MRRLLLAFAATTLLSVTAHARQQTYTSASLNLISSRDTPQWVEVRVPAYRDILDIQPQIRHTNGGCGISHSEWRTLPQSGESSLGWARRGAVQQTAEGGTVLVRVAVYSWLGSCARQGRVVVITN